VYKKISFMSISQNEKSKEYLLVIGVVPAERNMVG
jgi:hypothetical protein